MTGKDNVRYEQP